MRKLIYVFLIIGFLHLGYGLFVSFWRPGVFNTTLPQSRSLHFYDYAGLINVRTNKSSGSGTYDEILAAAKVANINFVIFTDLNEFKGDVSKELYVDGVHGYIGGEYSYLESRIINFFAQSDEHLQGPGRAQVTFADILSRNNVDEKIGVFGLSRPLKAKSNWQADLPIGFDAIEIINLKQVWQENWLFGKLSFIWTTFIYPFNSKLAYLKIILAAKNNIFSVWDSMNRNHETFGYFGSAAEANFRLLGDLMIRFPAYEDVFSIIKNHVLISSELTGNPRQDRIKIMEAFKQGQFYMSLDLLENPVGFESYATSEKGEILPLGAKAKFAPGMQLNVSLPTKPELPFEVNIYKDGVLILSSTSQTTQIALHGPGVYRSIVRILVSMPFPERKRWANWILTNPIYLN